MIEDNKSKKEKIKSKVQEYIEAIIIAISDCSCYSDICHPGI